MSGEVCVVTGATSGIGKATAIALASRGAHVVLVGRDRGRGEAAAAELTAAGGPAPRLEVADLASMGQVRALADRLGALARIDARGRPLTFPRLRGLKRKSRMKEAAWPG